MFGILTRNRRKKILSRPFPQEWLEILELSTPIYRRLPQDDRPELRDHISIFLAEKNFEGANGQKITDDVRISIASQACIMLLHRDSRHYPSLSSIIVYPGEFIAPAHEYDESGIMVEWDDCRAGEFAENGALTLSWEDVRMSGVDDYGSYNVVIHEFAHLVDAEQGITAGRHKGGGVWSRVFEREYLRLQHDAAHRRPSVLDHYGAESPAEFFAVAAETFFENPAQFRSKHPELYAGISGFFRQDPASWSSPGPEIPE